MPKKEKPTQENNDILPEEADQEFGISLNCIKELMETRGHDGIIMVNASLGGLAGLAEKLKTNLITGINLKRNFGNRPFKNFL